MPDITNPQEENESIGNLSEEENTPPSNETSDLEDDGFEIPGLNFLCLPYLVGVLVLFILVRSLTKDSDYRSMKKNAKESNPYGLSEKMKMLKEKMMERKLFLKSNPIVRLLCRDPSCSLWSPDMPYSLIERRPQAVFLKQH